MANSYLTVHFADGSTWHGQYYDTVDIVRIPIYSTPEANEYNWRKQREVSEPCDCEGELCVLRHVPGGNLCWVGQIGNAWAVRCGQALCDSALRRMVG